MTRLSRVSRLSSLSRLSRLSRLSWLLLGCILVSSTLSYTTNVPKYTNKLKQKISNKSRKQYSNYLTLASSFSSDDDYDDESQDIQIQSGNSNSNSNSNSISPQSEVTLKMAFDNSDIWGIADNAEEKSERFTSPSSLDLVHRLRRECDCVLVGRGTVERDDCTLTVRRVALKKDNQPVRVVIDPQLNILKKIANENESGNGNGNGNRNDYALLNDGLSTIVYHCKENVDWNMNSNVSLIKLSKSKSKSKINYISSQSIIDDLASRNIYHIMVEGGPITALSFLKDKKVDRAIIIRAPVTFIDPVLSNISEKTLIDAGLILLGTRMSDGDMVEYWSRDDLPWPNNNLESWP